MSNSFEKLGKLGAEMKYTEKKVNDLILQDFDSKISIIKVIDEDDAISYLYQNDILEHIKNAKYQSKCYTSNIVLEEVVPYFNGDGKYYLVVDFIHDHNQDLLDLRSNYIKVTRLLDLIKAKVDVDDCIRELQGLGIITNPNDYENQIKLYLERCRFQIKSIWNKLHCQSEGYKFLPIDLINSDKGKSSFELKGLTNITDFEPNQFYKGFEIHRKVDGKIVHYQRSRSYRVKTNLGTKTYTNCSEWLARKLASKHGTVIEITECEVRRSR